MKILLTGGTGAVGAELVALIHAAVPAAEITLVTRRPRTRPNTRVIVADLTSPFEQCPELIAAIRQATHVVHAAGDVHWNQSRDEAHRNNVAPTKNLIDALEKTNPGLERFVFVSTAFIESSVPDFKLDYTLEEDGRRFNNSYEWSKWKAEGFVRSCALDWAIVRPSLVVGHSQTGRIERYNGLFTFLKSIVRGRIPVIAGTVEAYVDIVPSDHVAEAILRATVDPSQRNRTTWVASGDAAPRLATIVRGCVDRPSARRAAYGLPPLQEPQIVPFPTYTRLYRPLIKSSLRTTTKTMVEAIEVFLPYFSTPIPFRIPASDLWHVPPHYDSYFLRSIDSWCDANLATVMDEPRRWGEADLHQEYHAPINQAKV